MKIYWTKIYYAVFTVFIFFIYIYLVLISALLYGYIILNWDWIKIIFDQDFLEILSEFWNIVCFLNSVLIGIILYCFYIDVDILKIVAVFILLQNSTFYTILFLFTAIMILIIIFYNKVKK